MKQVIKLAALAVVGTFGFAAQSMAAPVEWSATGTVNGGFTLNTDDTLAGIGAGDTFTFNFTFDPAAAPLTNFLGTATYARPYAASLSVGSYSKSWDSSGNLPTTVTNTALGDAFTVNANDPFASASLAFSQFLGGPLNSTALPGNAALLNGFANSLFTFGLVDLNGIDGFTGTINNVAPVPLPAAAWLLLSGLTGVAAFARRRRRTDEALVGAAA